MYCEDLLREQSRGFDDAVPSLSAPIGKPFASHTRASLRCNSSIVTRPRLAECGD